MMKSLTAIIGIFLLSIGVFAQDPGILVAKCGFPALPKDDILPGTPFIYIFKKGDQVSVVNSIANRRDKITDRSIPLLGELTPTLAKIDDSGISWKQPYVLVPSIPGDEQNSIGVSLDDPSFVNQLVTTIGTSSFTTAVYPTCFVWK